MPGLRRTSILARLATSLAAIITIDMLTVNPVAADDIWTFCLATNFRAHKTYFTNLVRSDGPSFGLEDLVEGALVRAGILVNIVQCPLGQSRTRAAANLRRAKDFNVKIDNRILDGELVP